jgi:hypothetical protein
MALPPRHLGQALALKIMVVSLLSPAAAIAVPRTAPELPSTPPSDSSPLPQPRDWWETSPSSSPERPFLLEQWGERDRQNQQYQNLQDSLRQQQQQDRDRYEQRQREWQQQQQQQLQQNHHH